MMVERPPQSKQDEQYPLLKVDGGSGDGATNQPAPNLVAPGWAVTCTPKQSWLLRWPEYVSACWMTLILLGISFLVFYALGMEAYRRQPVLLIKCNRSQPASDVFYHQIIPRGATIPIMLYAEYLASMAAQYPMLHLHVYFLVDDSVSSYRNSKHSRIINTIIPLPLSNVYPVYKLDDISKRDLAEFQRRYYKYHVNVTVMSLSRYMAMTPLKYKWRNIPMPYLSFYARVFSVWQYGGVGMDLCTFNNYFNNRQHIDRRISAILKQHNDGIKAEDYTNALNKIDREEENELFSLFFGLVHSILNDTRTFLKKSFPFPLITPEKDSVAVKEPLPRTRRNKREISPPSDMKSTETVFVETLNSSDVTDLKKNEYQTVSNNDVNKNLTTTKETDNLTVQSGNNKMFNKTESRIEFFNKTDRPQMVFFYNFSMISDNVAPPLVLPGVFAHSDMNGQMGRESKIGNDDDNGTTYLLSLDYDGLFIAASSRLHPFLGQVIVAGCQRMHPKFAIQDTILTQCSGLFKEDTFCTNIYLL